MEVMDEKDVRRRLQLILDWGNCCVVCGEPFANLACVTLEHTIPKSMGGKQGDNLAPSHFNCNKHRGNKSLIESDISLRFKRRLMGEASFKTWISRPVPSRIVPPLAMLDLESVLTMVKD